MSRNESSAPVGWIPVEVSGAYKGDWWHIQGAVGPPVRVDDAYVKKIVIGHDQGFTELTLEILVCDVPGVLKFGKVEELQISWRPGAVPPDDEWSWVSSADLDMLGPYRLSTYCLDMQWRSPKQFLRDDADGLSGNLVRG